MGVCGNCVQDINSKGNDLNEFSNDSIERSQSNFSNLETIKTKEEEKNNNVCYIIEENKIVGIGFLCKIPSPDKCNSFSVFITCNNNFNSNAIMNGKEIKLLFNLNNNNMIKILRIDESRAIYMGNEKEYNITIIEIKENDGFKNHIFLEIDIDICEEDSLLNMLINNPINIINCSNSFNSEYSKSLIKNINNNNFIIDNSYSTLETLLSGVPIINIKNSKIIGIYIGKNIGIFLRNPIKEFIKCLKNDNFKNQKGCNERNESKKLRNYINFSKNEIKSITDSYRDNLEELNSEFKTKNEINLLLEIEKEDINNNIYFLGISNELNESNIKLYINNKENNYMKYLVPQKEGIYNIKIIINIPIKDCSHMFSDCNKLSNIDLSSFNTEKVTNMSYMFSGCSKLNKIDLSSFDTKNVTNMSFMFKGCSNLKNLNLSNLNTKNVNYMIGMFCDCSDLTDLDLTSFDTKNVIYMSYIFCRCSNLININLESLDTKNVTNMSNMFDGCYKLANINLSNLDTKNVTYMVGMFSDCSNLVSIDLSNFNTQKVIDTNHMFSGCFKLKNIDLSCFDTNNITNMSYMFLDCFDLTNIDFSSLDPKKVNNTDNMFNGCDNLNEIKINKNCFDFNKSKLSKKVNIINH